MYLTISAYEVVEVGENGSTKVIYNGSRFANARLAACLHTAKTHNTTYLVGDSSKPYRVRYQWNGLGVLAHAPLKRGAVDSEVVPPLPRHKSVTITHEEAEILTGALTPTYGLKMVRATG